MANVKIVATGGTIANMLDGRVPVQRVLDDIGERHPETTVADVAEVSVDDVLRDTASAFTPREWMTIGRAVDKWSSDPSVDGIVVTHGTFTAEETAYFLHLTVHTDKPVVLACSQRKHGTIGNDGDKNLYDAVRVAADPQAAGRGVMVLLNEEIHSARDVTKTNQRPSGFASNGFGILGSVEVDQVSFYRAPGRRHTTGSEFDVSATETLPRVDVVATYAGADGHAVDAFLAAGTEGIVVSGFAYSGKPHDLQLPALRRALARGVPVVLGNRGGDGRVPANNSEEFVGGDNLTPQKARVLLTVAMTSTREPAELQRIFSEY